MILASFVALMLMCLTIALTDWRRGWLMAVVVGVLQDPVRKVTPGAWVGISLSILVIYAVVLLGGRSSIEGSGRQFTRRFPNVYSALLLTLAALVLAAANGIMTFGMGNWMVPTLSLVIYCLPIPAVALGYAYVQREEQIERFLRFYSVLTSLALIGTVLEYYRVPSRLLGTVAFTGENLRFLPGIQLRMLSGFYRAPDVMGWHAATLACIGILMSLRRRKLAFAWPWMVAAGWGLLNALLSGRRKAIYMVAVFTLAFIWRYFKRLTISNLISFAFVGVVLLLVVTRISHNDEASVYTRSALTTGSEIYGRLEGGVGETLRQNSLLGAGLGAATQGTQHLTGGVGFGWQEGGLSKLAIEVGVPGMIAIALLVVSTLSLLLKITAHPDVPESAQLIRAGLFAIFVADVASFLASAQVYSDPLVVLMTSFILGALLATAGLDERAPVVIGSPTIVESTTT